MELSGKGFYVWQIEQCENGDVEKIAQLASQANLAFVMVKVADGKFEYFKNKAKLAPLVAALRSRGISPWGWQYIYGVEPAAEARIAAQQVKNLGLDGFVVNAEGEFKQPGKAEAARTYLYTLGRELPNTPLALSSYRFPSYHPQFPWREFLDVVDLNFPQVYWQGAHNPRIQLQQSIREFNGMFPYRPVIPTGAAYSEHNWTPTTADLEGFLQAARDFKLPAVSFWEWAAARKHQLWDTIAQFNWPPVNPQPKDIVERLVAALNTRNPDEVIKFYAANAALVNPSQSVQGLADIRAWYQRLFTVLMPQVQFTLTGYSGTGTNRHFTWTAVSSAGSVLNGNDTFSTINQQIVYHFSYFSIA